MVSPISWRANPMNSYRSFLLWFAVLALLLQPHYAVAQQTTAFTYQGQLRDGGTNAGGTYGMAFKLFDAVANGNQVGSTLTNSVVLVNGLFSVNLDFGNVFDGGGRWLDITVQAVNGAPETLVPRVHVLPSPYALFATKAASLANGTVQNPTFFGTTDLTPLNLSVNNQPALRIQPFTNTANVIAGYSGNTVSNGFTGATIAGGGASVLPELVDGLPSPNLVGANYATVGGGARNTASGIGSTVPGGIQNVAAGKFSFAAGNGANAVHDNSFVWSDSTNAGGFSSTTNKEFSVRASRGVRFETGGSGVRIDGIKVSSDIIPQFQLFETNGTFIVPAGVTRIMVELWGGGGGGGGGAGGAGGTTGGNGGGGGGGCYGQEVISVVPGTSVVVTVGSGGIGGSGGTNTIFSNVNTAGTAGGSGGTSSIGSVSVAGGAGGNAGGSAGTVNGSSGGGGNPGTSTTARIFIQGVRGGNGFDPSQNGGDTGQGGAAGHGGSGGNRYGDGNNGSPGTSPGGGGGAGSGIQGDGTGSGGSVGTTAGNGAGGASGRVIVWF
jgi:hypothetical protein